MAHEELTLTCSAWARGRGAPGSTRRRGPRPVWTRRRGLAACWAGWSAASAAPRSGRAPPTATRAPAGTCCSARILDAAELAAARADLAETLPPDPIPFENDGADNHLLVGLGTGNSGQVFRYLHDAPTPRQVELVDDSFEHFLSALHPGE